MAFIWNDESLAILRENAGILTTEQIAQLLHTNNSILHPLFSLILTPLTILIIRLMIDLTYNQ